MILLVIIITVLIGIYEIPLLVKNKLIKDLIVFTFFLIFSCVFSILLSLNIKIPNPIDTLIKIYKVFNDLLNKI